MNQKLKRLELIKTAIELDDEEIIELQLIKLETLDIDEEIKSILSKLKELDYGKAVVDIENYLKKYKEVALYQDPQIQGLKLELKTLEKKLQTLSETKTEYINDIDEFNREYHLKLGSLIEEILKLKQEILEQELKTKQERYKEEQSLHVDTQDVYNEITSKIEELEEFLENIDEDDERYDEINQVYEELKENLKELEDELETQKENLSELEDKLENEEFHNAKEEYEEFSNEYEHIKEESQDICDITKEEQQKLKKLFREASRLCHPDIVVDELKKQAHQIMQALNEAYSKKDLKAVQKILTNLKNGIAFEVASNKIDDKKVLKAKIDELREKIDDIDKELESIKEDDIFETISKLDDWDEYFQSVKEALEEEKNSLVNRVSSKELHVEKQPIIKTTSVKQESSKQSKDLKNIELVTFEKIRRYYSNLKDADDLHVEFATDARKHKALIYSALDVFLDNFEGQSINIVDWDCSQGMATTLVLDYIREKQLDIKVTNILLIEEEQKALSRAMLHVDIIKDEALQVKIINKNSISIETENIKIYNKNITIHILSNIFNINTILNYTFFDKIVESQEGTNYFLFTISTSNQSKIVLIEEFYGYFEYFSKELLSSTNKKIGRYERYEKIFKLDINHFNDKFASNGMPF